MKKFFYILLAALLLLVTSMSCTKEDHFNFSKDELCGTWEGTGIKTDPGKPWIDITQYPYDKFKFSITFYSNGTYYGRGYFGNGEGTYKAFGNTIETYVEGVPYFIYTVKSMKDNKAELTMSSGGSSMEIRVVKR